jgi:hypothetical protein
MIVARESALMSSSIVRSPSPHISGKNLLGYGKNSARLFCGKAVVKDPGFVRAADESLGDNGNSDLAEVCLRFAGGSDDLKPAASLRNVGLEHNGKIRTRQLHPVAQACHAAPQIALPDKDTFRHPLRVASASALSVSYFDSPISPPVNIMPSKVRWLRIAPPITPKASAAPSQTSLGTNRSIAAMSSATSEPMRPHGSIPTLVNI